MRRSLLVLALSVVPLSACTVHVNDGGATPPSESAGESSQAEAEGSGGDPADPDSPDSEPPPRAETAPTGLPDCPAEPGDDSYCTRDGKLAGQWVMADQLRIPAGAEIIFEATHAEAERQPGLTVAVDGDDLYIKQVTCGSCARVMGQGFHGALSSMREEQITAVQARLGLPADSDPLTSVDRWRRYCIDGAGSEALTALSTRNEL